MQLLAEDPALKRFKSHKKSVNAVKRMGDVLTLVVVAGKRFKISSIFEEYMVDMKSNAKWTYWNKSNLFNYLKSFHVSIIFLKSWNELQGFLKLSITILYFDKSLYVICKFFIIGTLNYSIVIYFHCKCHLFFFKFFFLNYFKCANANGLLLT